jgi:hypothetical protein
MDDHSCFAGESEPSSEETEPPGQGFGLAILRLPVLKEYPFLPPPAVHSASRKKHHQRVEIV